MKMKFRRFSKTFMISVLLLVDSTDLLVSEAKEFRNLMKSRIDAVAGLLPTSKDVILNEIRRRQSQDDCLKGFRFCFSEDFEQRENLKPSEHIVSVGYIEYDFSGSFDSPIPCHLTETFAVKEKYLWMFVPFVNTDGTANSRLFSYACFTDSDKQVWMPFVGNNVYRVESMEMNERVLTLRNGSDEMVIRMTFDTDCNQAPNKTNEMWHRIRESPVFSLSGPFNWRICDTLGLSVDLCETAKENSCAISRAKQNYCIRLDNVGPSKRCDATMEITKLTGMFREKSLLVSETPMKVMGSKWIRGNRSLAMITPCFK